MRSAQHQEPLVAVVEESVVEGSYPALSSSDFQEHVVSGSCPSSDSRPLLEQVVMSFCNISALVAGGRWPPADTFGRASESTTAEKMSCAKWAACMHPRAPETSMFQRARRTQHRGQQRASNDGRRRKPIKVDFKSI